MVDAFANAKPQAYSATLKWLHWTMALAILSLIPIGLSLDKVAPGPALDRLYGLHEEFGFLILLAAFVRVYIRLKNGTPSPSKNLSPFERTASTFTHRVFYLLIFAMPLLGWAAVSAYGAQIDFFGLFNIPSLLPKNEPLSKVLFNLHSIGGFTFAGLVLLHIGGALRHFLIKCDDVMARMMPKS